MIMIIFEAACHHQNICWQCPFYAPMENADGLLWSDQGGYPKHETQKNIEKKHQKISTSTQNVEQLIFLRINCRLGPPGDNGFCHKPLLTFYRQLHQKIQFYMVPQMITYQYASQHINNEITAKLQAYTYIKHHSGKRI